MRFVEFASVNGTEVMARLEDLHLEKSRTTEGDLIAEVHHGPTGRYWYVSPAEYQSLYELMAEVQK